MGLKRALLPFDSHEKPVFFPVSVANYKSIYMKVASTCKEEAVTSLLLQERRGSIETDWLFTDRISGGVKNIASS